MTVEWSVANSSPIYASIWEPHLYSDVRHGVLTIQRRFYYVLGAEYWVASVLKK